MLSIYDTVRDLFTEQELLEIADAARNKTSVPDDREEVLIAGMREIINRPDEFEINSERLLGVLELFNEHSDIDQVFEYTDNQDIFEDVYASPDTISQKIYVTVELESIDSLPNTVQTHPIGQSEETVGVYIQSAEDLESYPSKEDLLDEFNQSDVTVVCTLITSSKRTNGISRVFGHDINSDGSDGEIAVILDKVSGTK